MKERRGNRILKPRSLDEFSINMEVPNKYDQ